MHGAGLALKVPPVGSALSTAGRALWLRWQHQQRGGGHPTQRPEVRQLLHLLEGGGVWRLPGPAGFFGVRQGVGVSRGGAQRIPCAAWVAEG